MKKTHEVSQAQGAETQKEEFIMPPDKIPDAVKLDMLTARGLISIISQDEKVAAEIVRHLRGKLKDDRITIKSIQNDATICGSLLASIHESTKIISDIVDFTIGVQENVINQRKQMKDAGMVSARDSG